MDMMPKSRGESRSPLRHMVLLAMMPLAMAGCGLQRGRFVTSGDQYAPFEQLAGCVHIVDGYDPEATHKQSATPQHLLYILFISPCIRANGSGANSDFGEYVTTISHTWNIEAGTLTASIRWDRQKDTVLIGTQKFSRDKGNVFIVRLLPGKEPIGQQLLSLNWNANFQQVLQYAMQQLPSDSLIGSLKLLK
jgi:hypothetical protein